MKLFAKGFVALAIFGIINFGLNFNRVEAEEIISDTNISSETAEIQEFYGPPLPHPRHGPGFHRHNPPPLPPPHHRPGFHRRDPYPPPPPPSPPPSRRGHYPPPRHW